MREAVSDLVQKVKDDRAQTLAEQEAEAAKRRAHERMKYAWLFVAVVAFAASVAFTIPRLKTPIRAPEGAEAERHGRATLVYAARLVEDYQRATGSLPSRFDDTGVTLPGVILQIRPDGWELSLPIGGRAPTTLALRSGDDRASFLQGR
jgi:hypothetical protein